MTAFMDGCCRQVAVPDNECSDNLNSMLDRIYHWGQNEVQPVHDRCSVSAGDTIEYQNNLYIVLLAGFSKISKQQLAEFTKLKPAQRIKYLIKIEKK